MKKTLLATALVFTFFIPTPVQAFFNLGGCAAAGAGGAAAGAVSKVTAVPVTNTLLETNAAAQTSKECVLDGLASVLTQSLITSTTNSIISWINNGFDGGPAFITNYSAFLGNIANNVAVDFIQGSELGFLCSPFENPIRLALIRDYQRQNSFSQRISCSLEDSIAGGFLQGDFSQGGWQSLFRIATEPQNNPYYAYLEAQDHLNSRIVDAQTEVLRQTSEGGFLSKQACVEYGEASHTGGEPVCIRYEVVTPGTQIESQLDHVLGSGLRQLELADEIDEVINALLAQLSQQAFTSIDGLRGLSSNSASSALNGQSYLGRLSSEVDSTTYTQARTVLIDDIELAIQYEGSYQDVLDDVIVGYEGAKSDFEGTVTACNNSGNSSLGTTAQNTLNTGITPVLADYKNLKTSSIQRVSTLVTLRSKAQNANAPEELNAVADEYEVLIETGTLQTSGDIAFLAQEYQAQQGTFATYNTQLSTTFAVCGI